MSGRTKAFLQPANIRLTIYNTCISCLKPRPLRYSPGISPRASRMNLCDFCHTPPTGQEPRALSQHRQQLSSPVVCIPFAAAARGEITMFTQRTITLLIAGAAIVAAGAAAAQSKVVVYTSNDSNLNRFVFDAFKKETGIEVEPVEAGSGVVFRRMASERERPLGDIVWGVSRTLLRANKALLAPYASKNKDAVPAHFRDPEDYWIGTNVHLLGILQDTELN